MSPSKRSNGINEQADSHSPITPRMPDLSPNALMTPMVALDAFRALLDATWSASARLWTAGEELHRLQSAALDDAAKAISKAATDAENARDVQDLFRVQVQLANSMLEQTAALSRQWLDRLISMSSELTPPGTVAPPFGGPSVAASTHDGSDGSTIWPTDMLFNAQTAWSQWAQQLASTVNRGLMPS